MVKINKIYTRNGDQGQTSLVGGQKVNKTSRRVIAYGCIDELNSLLGCIRFISKKNKYVYQERIAELQNKLFDLGSELACDPSQDLSKIPTISAEDSTSLEAWIDEITSELPELTSFVLPGDSELNSRLHHARAVCRRAEICVWQLAEEEQVSEHVLIYLNRLSDLLFALARHASKYEGVKELLWKPGK